jgi:hypothetical protein
VSAKWDYDKTTVTHCGEPYDEYYFVRGDEPKEWTLTEVAKHLSAMEGVLDARAAEIERLRGALEACKFLYHTALAGKEKA